MNAKEKKTFIKSLTKSIQDELINKIPTMPEHWDGIELRWLLAEKFDREQSDCWRSSPARKRKYKNETITRNI